MRVPTKHLWAIGWLAASLGVGGLPRAKASDATVEAVQLMREGGCGGISPAAPALDRSALLDRAASRWAAGAALLTAAGQSGYTAEVLVGIRVSGGRPDTIVQALRRSECPALTDRRMRELGVHHRGMDAWIVLAAPSHPPSRADAPVLASRVLDLVNVARSQGARCGARRYAPAPPLRASGTLDHVALGHASDMALNDYFEHRDLSGRSPADRVRAMGYRETLVGENIAYGVGSAEEAVHGWLDSPGHCENIMDPRFAEMGVAFAQGHTAAKRGLYWVQVLAAPATGAVAAITSSHGASVR